MRARKRQPARPVPPPVSRAAWRLRRWVAAGRRLETADPQRAAALLLLAEQIVKAHAMRDRARATRARDLIAEIRRRFRR